MNKAWGHFKTITRHRHLVMKQCFRVGLYRNGLLHDLSKYSPTEFRIGAKYYQGTRSPNAVEREVCGHSTAWMHHKGRNKHHFEYWTDLVPGTVHYGPVPMPTRYFVEMVMDRIAACKVYKGENYTDGAALEYLLSARDSKDLHPDTYEKLLFVLTMLKEKGEQETFCFIREVVLKEVPFSQWQA
ncbi:MAG: catalase [Oscillospiraceae bacterium]|nr:catalase [Oscillospiraceae bacterium]